MDLFFSFNDNLHAQFVAAYAKSLAASGAKERFDGNPSTENAVALTMAMYEAVHDAAPEGAKVALMYSGGKDSSTALYYFTESILARVAASKRYVTGSAICSSTQHEFAAIDIRQKNEIEALNKWGVDYGFTAEIVTPHAKHTVMCELLGAGLALPPRANNDKIAISSISNWCVSRVKKSLLDLAVERAAEIAPLVIQVLGSRSDESTARGASMNKYSEGMPFGLTRMAARDADEVDPRFIGLNAIGHFTITHVRDFVHNAMPAYRPMGNLELEQIYRDMAGDKPGVEATECSIQRAADGSFAGGCSNLLTGVRSGCQICLKSVNNALKNLAEKDQKRYGLTYRLQQRINRHQDLVHARPLAVKATGLTPNQVFPKGFTFTERYIMLVILMAAEIESGERQLTDEQLAWIERRWQRHGIFTVTPADARSDAYQWLTDGCVGDPVPFFVAYGELAGDFTKSMGSGMSLAAFAAHCDDEQADLNLAHMLGMGITGESAFPKILSYVFADRSNPDRLIVAVTDEPAVIGTRTQTGLINGMSGAMLKCIGVRSPSEFERQMADCRHLFYEVLRSQAPRYMEQVERNAQDAVFGTRWELSNFLQKGGPTKQQMASFFIGHAATWLDSLGEANGASCGIDFDPITEQYHRHEAISDLRGKLTRADIKKVFAVVGEQVEISETLRDMTESAHTSLLDYLRATLNGDWAKLSGDNDSGKSLRKAIRVRLKEDMFGSKENLDNYREYLASLKELTKLYRDGVLNTSLAVKVAFIIRTSWYCEKDAEEDLMELLTLLRIKDATVEPMPTSAPAEQLVASA